MQLAMQMPPMLLRPAPRDWTDDFARDFEADFRLAEGADIEEPAPVGVTDPLGFWGVLGLVMLALIVGVLAGGLGAFIAAAPASCEVL